MDTQGRNPVIPPSPKPPRWAGLEVPIFGPQDGLAAVEAGAARLELNASSSYDLGGTTPTLPSLTRLIHLVGPDSRIPIRVMIRPRGPPPDGSLDFIYTPDELDAMINSISEFKQTGSLNAERGDGFVFGCLSLSEGDSISIDQDACRALRSAAEPFVCVFHRAVDEVLDSEGVELEGLIRDMKGIGFGGMLTSGGRGDAVDNKVRLGSICTEAKAQGFEVVVGGGLRVGNVRRIGEVLGEGTGLWAHSSCLRGGEFDVSEARGLASVCTRGL